MCRHTRVPKPHGIRCPHTECADYIYCFGSSSKIFSPRSSLRISICLSSFGPPFTLRWPLRLGPACPTSKRSVSDRLTRRQDGLRRRGEGAPSSDTAVNLHLAGHAGMSHFACGPTRRKAARRSCRAQSPRRCGRRSWAASLNSDRPLAWPRPARPGRSQCSCSSAAAARMNIGRGSTTVITTWVWLDGAAVAEVSQAGGIAKLPAHTFAVVRRCRRWRFGRHQFAVALQFFEFFLGPFPL